jgi:cyclopropane fatty-acyl-phospholipid synthase-like methyltransferase
MEWWEEFFKGDWVDIHASFWTDAQTTSQVDSIERLLELEPGDTILDVPCGEGRIARQLASRGYLVTGVDRSPELLDLAAKAAAAAGLDIRWEQRDMRDLPWDGTFDAVVCWWGSFGYFDEAANASFLEALARVLKPGGRLVLENHVVETVLPHFQARSWEEAGKGFTLTENRWDHTTGRIEGTWTLIVDGKQTVKDASIRLYTYAELVALLKVAGFAKVRGVDPTTDAEFQLGATKLVLIADK